ncbi:hypothetical protein ACHAXS_006202, partial [Conticribra weissflogii]
MQSCIDGCIFYKGNIIFIVHVDDGIFLGATGEQQIGEKGFLQCVNLDMEDQVHPSDYIGTNIQHHKNCSYKFTQQVLINAI